MADEDVEYTTWIRRRPCWSCHSTLGVVCHHATCGGTAPVFPVEGEPLLAHDVGRRGQRQRAHDHWGIPLCDKLAGGRGCHQNLHAMAGPFREFSGAQLREWQTEAVRQLRAQYLDKETF